ncbi:MAG: hypothetical protein IJ737_06635 [Ruminococcus sp.]|nr:hypothetical protein [Ruminococcus sp.]
MSVYYKGIELADQAELQLAVDEEARINSILYSVPPDDISAIDSAIQRISAFRTPIKLSYLNELTQRKAALRRAQCTFMNKVYPTPDEASAAAEEFRRTRNAFQSTDMNSFESVSAACDIVRRNRYHEGDEMKNRIISRYNELEKARRTVVGIEFSTVEQAKEAEQELAVINQIFISVREDDEASMLNAKKQISEQLRTPVRGKYLARIDEMLAAYDIEQRSFEGRLCDTREEAKRLRYERGKINEIFATLDHENEDSIYSAKRRLAAMTTDIGEEARRSVDNILRRYDEERRTFRGYLYRTREEASLAREEYDKASTMLAMVNMQNENELLGAKEELSGYRTYAREEFLTAVNDALERYDLNARTFNGQVYETRAMAELAQKEMAEIPRIMNGVNGSDEASMKEAIRQLEALRSGVGEPFRQQVMTLYQGYDQRMRTFDGIIFPTRAEAEAARISFEKFLDLFQTLDLSDKASQLKLYNVIEDELDDRTKGKAYGVMNELKAVLTESEYIRNTAQIVNPAYDRDQSRMLRYRIEQLIPRLDRLRLDSSYFRQLWGYFNV